MASESLKSYLQKNGIFISKEFQLHTNVVNLKKGELISKVGDIECNIYFLISGKVVGEMDNGNILDFIFHDQLFTSLSSLLTQEPMDINHKCLTKCTIETIPFKPLKEACDRSIMANKFLNHFLSVYYLVRVRNEKDMASKTIEERYLNILKNRPELLHEISSANLARYLNIHPNSLSRLKRKWVSKSRKKK